MEEKIYAIEKMRNIVAWSNYQDESVNFQLQSMSEIETVYDILLEQEGVEFIDNLDSEDEDDLELMKLINNRLNREFFKL